MLGPIKSQSIAASDKENLSEIDMEYQSIVKTIEDKQAKIIHRMKRSIK